MLHSRVCLLAVSYECVCVADPLTCPDRKQRERMVELQERRRSLQALLSSRLAELRRICLQEAVSDVIKRDDNMTLTAHSHLNQSLLHSPTNPFIPLCTSPLQVVFRCLYLVLEPPQMLILCL